MQTKRIRNQKDPTIPKYNTITTTTRRCSLTKWAALQWLFLVIWFGSLVAANDGGTVIPQSQLYTSIPSNQVQMPHLTGAVYQVEISNCKMLTIEANVLGDTIGLRRIIFKHVDNLVLQKYALAFPRHASNTPLIVEFEEVNFKLIDSHAINGNIEEISFLGGSIEAIHSFGFTTIKDKALLLKMDRVLIKKIETQAFKKFAVEQMEMTNCVFDSNVPSKAFYELEILNLMRINNVQFKYVHSRAFSFKEIRKLSISNNRFTGLDAEWMEAHVRESILISENNFGETSPIAFKGLTVHRDYLDSERLELRFFNNTLNTTTEPLRPLEFSERLMVSIRQLKYENPFPCSNVDSNMQPPRPRQIFFAQHMDNIFFTRVMEEGGAIDPTAKSQTDQIYVGLSKIIEEDCHPRSYLLYIILGVIVTVLVIVIVACAVWLRIAKKRKRRKLDIVMPESRTYKETQIIYKIENAGLLKTDL